jgi:hypothetical protein
MIFQSFWQQGGVEVVGLGSRTVGEGRCDAMEMSK